MTILLAVAMLLQAHGTQAQTPVQIPANTAVQVAYDHDGLNVDGFRLKVDGTPLATTVGKDVRVIDLAPLPSGNHTILVTAFNTDGETDSDPLLIYVKKPGPSKPLNPRIVSVTLGTTGATIKVQ
jgi:hypothetical protein